MNVISSKYSQIKTYLTGDYLIVNLTFEVFLIIYLENISVHI